LAVIFIDGISDYILHLLRTHHNESIDTFTDKDNKKSYFLKFNPTLWVDGDDMRNSMNNLSKSIHTKYGGIGCVSVYFYKAIKGLKSPDIPDYTLQQIPLKENKGKLHGINLSTTFVEKSESLMGKIHKKPYVGWKPEGKALAVLHLHYRPTYWLRLSEIIPESLFSYQKLNWFNANQKNSHLISGPRTPSPTKVEKSDDLYRNFDVHTPQDKIFDINTVNAKYSVKSLDESENFDPLGSPSPNQINDLSNVTIKEEKDSREENINKATYVAGSNVKPIIIIDDSDDEKEKKNMRMNVERSNVEENTERIKQNNKNNDDKNDIRISEKRKCYQESNEILDLSRKKSNKWVAIKYKKV
jgi:hypothetical protein